MSQTKEAMSLKARILQVSKKNGIAAQAVLQNFFFERFLDRLSHSRFRDKFVLKGGLLIASIVGIGTRSTMDMDATLRNMPLTEETVLGAVQEICEIEMDDDVLFSDFTFEPIRKDDAYGGYRLKFNACFYTIKSPLSIDVSTGDVITPEPVEYNMQCVFDETQNIKVWGYNVETILAEKLETILSRGVANTRPRDFYDVYILQRKKRINAKKLRLALEATTAHRNSEKSLENVESVLEEIQKNLFLREQWERYRKKYSYAQMLSYESVVESVLLLMKKIEIPKV
ncbi:MAG: nucleotidyl transferase AbiEii/AbiGii toxin family protein [Fibrobacter sp.]|nr:nucleotidyl transferase AbiEii/AbiGii toxin family protein [Fibrobacter sp.]